MTPIYIDFTKTKPIYKISNYLDLYTEDPVNLYIEDTDPVTSTKERILAPRYYILIHAPVNQYQAPIKIDIEKAPHSLNNNQLRVNLNPSIGFGINACYRVEYWKWSPLLNSSATITKTKVHEEHWFVPSIDDYGYYVPNYYALETPRPWPHPAAFWNVSTHKIPELYWPYYYNRVHTKEFTISERVIDGDYVIDTIKTRDAMVLLRLYGENDSIRVLSQRDKFKYNQEVADWTFSKDTYGVQLRRLISGVNGLNTVDVDITGATMPSRTKVKYYLPFHPCDIKVVEAYLDNYIA